MRPCRNRSRPTTRRSGARAATGRAADTLTLYGLDDMRLRRLQIEESDASDEQKRVERQRLNALVALCEAPRCRRQTLLAYFGETTEPCGNCDLCVDGVTSFDGTVEAQKLLSAIARTGERFGTEHLINILVGEDERRRPPFRPRPAEDLRGRQGPLEERMALPPPPDLCRRPRRPRTLRIRPLDHHRTGRCGAEGPGADRAALGRADEAARAPPAPRRDRGAGRRAGGRSAARGAEGAADAARQGGKRAGLRHLLRPFPHRHGGPAGPRPARPSARSTASGRRSSSAMRRRFSRCCGSRKRLEHPVRRTARRSCDPHALRPRMS